MPRRKTSRATDRSADKKHLRNLRIKNDIKKSLKKFEKLLSTKNLAEAKTLLSQVFGKLDKAAKKNVLHQNKANRTKSQLAIRLRKSA
ncbi:MAG TPA: 30S ribosomal protein S20 [Candidatus Omnitrophota bacterium]|nr:30S ribosomal protein S20 [Candidatus Omnitrophota bacterium]HPT07074.1 30S ribosomal protein S20 [Candidatus Omnitrophota bacterium]